MLREITRQDAAGRARPTAPKSTALVKEGRHLRRPKFREEAAMSGNRNAKMIRAWQVCRDSHNSTKSMPWYGRRCATKAPNDSRRQVVGY